MSDMYLLRSLSCRSGSSNIAAGRSGSGFVGWTATSNEATAVSAKVALRGRGEPGAGHGRGPVHASSDGP